MNEKQFITQFIDEERHTMNPQLFVRNDMEIVEQLKNIILSCQKSNPYFTIKVEGFDVIDDYGEINRTLEKYYDDLNGKKKKNSKTKRKENIYSYIDINHTAMRLLRVQYYISAEGGKDEDKEMRITVLIGVPRVVDKYYCQINGIKRSILYQIVDGSTYNNNTSSQKSPTITQKTIFMAVRIYKYYMDLKTAEGETIKAVNYVSRIFNKRVQAPKYIFAKYGFYDAMNFFGVRGILLSETAIADENYYCFKKADKYFVCCPKILFDGDYVVQSICSMLYNSIIPGVPFEILFGREYWLRSLGADFNGTATSKMLQMMDPNDNIIQDTLPKGYSVLDSFESIYDLNGKNVIKLPEEYKKDMYCILRWLLREFNELRLKDNLDISIKRIRFAEYMASMYAMKVAKGIYRVADMNKRASCSSLVKALRTDPMYLLTAISRCRMVEYRNMTSDMDSLVALKFTYKGVSGLGETNSQTIPLIYRYIHPSHVGRVDLDASSDGDPGMKGIISPFAKIHEGGYFEEEMEPNGWEESFAQLVSEWERVNNLIEPMEFQSKILGIDKSEEIAIANEAAYMAKQIIKPYINQALYMSESIPLEDLDDAEVFRIFQTGI